MSEVRHRGYQKYKAVISSEARSWGGTRYEDEALKLTGGGLLYFIFHDFKTIRSGGTKIVVNNGPGMMVQMI